MIAIASLNYLSPCHLVTLGFMFNTMVRVILLKYVISCHFSTQNALEVSIHRIQWSPGPFMVWSHYLSDLILHYFSLPHSYLRHSGCSIYNEDTDFNYDIFETFFLKVKEKLLFFLFFLFNFYLTYREDMCRFVTWVYCTQVVSTVSNI